MKMTQKVIIGFFIILIIPMIAGGFIISFVDESKEDVYLSNKYLNPIKDDFLNYKSAVHAIAHGTFMYASNEKDGGRDMIAMGKDGLGGVRQNVPGLLRTAQIMESEEEEAALYHKDKVENIYDQKTADDLQIKENEFLAASDKIVADIDAAVSSEQLKSDLDIFTVKSELAISAADASFARADAFSQEEDKEVIEKIDYTFKMVLFVVIASILASLLVALIVLFNIVKPIKQLKEITGLITDGNFDAVLPEIKGNDEISDLAASIEMLITSVKNNLPKKVKSKK